MKFAQQISLFFLLLFIPFFSIFYHTDNQILSGNLIFGVQVLIFIYIFFNGQNNLSFILLLSFILSFIRNHFIISFITGIFVSKKIVFQNKLVSDTLAFPFFYKI